MPLNDWEVGAKLALSITNTIPDDTLLAAAAAGQLHDKAGVTTQAKRLLDGTTGTAGINDLNLQVYRLGAYDGITRDPTVFPDFKPNTPAAMKQEVLQFLELDLHAEPRDQGLLHDAGGLRGLAARAHLRRDRHLLQRPDHAHEGRSRSDPAVRSADPGRVPVLVHLGGQRAGHHPPRRVHRRAAAVQDAAAARPRGRRDDDPRDAGPDQPATGGDDDREGDVRRGLPRGRCSTRSDTRSRTTTPSASTGRPTRDSRSTLRTATRSTASSSRFNNGVELSQLLADAKETHACYLQNMMSYLHGRQLDDQDQTTVDYYARLSRAGMVSLHDLELAIVTSDAFLNRLP